MDFKKYSTKHHNINSLYFDDYFNKQSKKSSQYLDDGFSPALFDVFSKLLNDRIIFLNTELESGVCNLIKAQLLYLESVSDDDISIYIDSPGGSVYSGLGLLDVMDYIKSDIATINTGMAASMGSVLLGAGTKGKRSSLRFSKVMLHQSSGGFRGNIQDAEIDWKEWQEVNSILFELLGDFCDKAPEQVKTDSQRDFWMSAQEAVDYGIIDEIVKGKRVR
jgi:ATP-dependent Clp protease protease subunit